MLFEELHETQKHVMWTEYRILNIKAGVTCVATLE